MTLQAPFRYDIVGSFLRPEVLKETRRLFEQGVIPYEKLKEVEDQEITKLIEKQKEIGLHTITDGEFRRKTWHLDFMWGFDGVGHQQSEKGILFAGEPAMIDDTYLVDKVKVDHHPFVDHFVFVKKFEDENTVARQTIPAPAQFLFQMIIPDNIEKTLSIYKSIDDLIEDIVAGYKKVIDDLYQAGCRNVQLDDCTWGVLVDENATLILNTDEDGLLKIMKQFVDINNQVIDGKPNDLVMTSHICRGNFHSTWACQGGYEKVARDLFGYEHVDAFYLEFDDERSGGFEPLRYLAAHPKVVLGLVTTKHPQLEDKAVIKQRIQEASKYVSLDRLCLSPQCGFASTEEGNKLTEKQQWDKIRLVKEIALEVWH